MNEWQDKLLPTRLLQSHNLVSTIAGVLERPQEVEPLMTREELRDINHRQSISKDFRQAKMNNFQQFSVYMR